MYSIKNSIWVFLLILFAFNNYAQVDDLDQMIEQAILLSPKIKMLKAKKDAAYNRIEQNSNLPDPLLTLGLVNVPTNSFSLTQDPMTQKFVGLKQTFPFPGKLSAIEDAAAIDTSIVYQEIWDAENEIRKNVSKKYYELSYLRRAILLSEESKRLLEEISEVVGAKYMVSSASQQNLIKVQLEITNILEKLENLRSKERSVVAELNAFLLRSADDEIKTDTFDDIDFLEINISELDSIARIYRPFLKGLKLAEDKARLKQYVAEKEFYPNIMVGVQYSFRDKLAATGVALNDLFSVVLGFSVPLNYGGKISSKVEESISLQQFYSEQYSFAIQNLSGNFGSAVSQLESLEERITLFEEGLVPQAEQNFKSALASYQVNEVDFINVIDAQDQLYKIETNLYRLKADYLKQISDLEFLIGTNLTK
ncbi:MAG: TolC family protein [Ignavibacteriaceae bacterium]|jgi:outer membrane protein TolC